MYPPLPPDKVLKNSLAQLHVHQLIIISFMNKMLTVYGFGMQGNGMHVRNIETIHIYFIPVMVRIHPFSWMIKVVKIFRINMYL